jgi:hypothetical protein
LEDAINPDAAEMYSKSPKLYFQLARDAVVASKRLEKGVSIFDEHHVDEETVSNVSTVEQPGIKVLAFEDYHSNWLNTATSLESKYQKKKPIRAIELLKFKTQNTKLGTHELKEILAE